MCTGVGSTGRSSSGGHGTIMTSATLVSIPSAWSCCCRARVLRKWVCVSRAPGSFRDRCFGVRPPSRTPNPQHDHPGARPVMPSTTFADARRPAELVGTLHARRSRRRVRHPGHDRPRRPRRPRPLRPRADRLGQDHRLRHPARRPRRQGTPAVGPRGLVLVPTRELAAQVCGELEWLGGGRKLRVAAVYGGAGFGAQFKALRRGVDVLVACPGRLTDLIERGEVDLDEVEIVVVDEADRMADMGFLPAVSAAARPHARDPPDAPVLGHARRRRRPPRAALPARPVAPPPARGRPARRRTHRFWSRRPRRRGST